MGVMYIVSAALNFSAAFYLAGEDLYGIAVIFLLGFAYSILAAIDLN